MFHGGFGFLEAWNLPISWRHWFIGRLNKEFEKQRKSDDDGGNQPPPTASQMLELAQRASPTKLKRF